MARFVILSGSETHPRSWCAVQSRILDRAEANEIVDWSDLPWKHGIDFCFDALADRIGTAADTILVGHSIAGLILPILAERLYAAAEIYIAALTPEPGRSFYDRMFSGEDIFDQDWMAGYEDLRRSKIYGGRKRQLRPTLIS